MKLSRGHSLIALVVWPAALSVGLHPMAQGAVFSAAASVPVRSVTAGIAQPEIVADVVRLPIIEGSGPRFRRITTAERDERASKAVGLPGVVHERRELVAIPARLYTLRVQAASSRGPWNTPGRALRIELRPPWWNSLWLRVVYGALILLAVWWLYRMRVRQISRQLTMRLEERMAERTRIAQELHDTLMQGLLSASLQLSVANRQVPPDAAARPLLERVCALLRQMIEESRNAVTDLRTRRFGPEDLERAFARIPQELMADERIKFRLIVEGTPRLLRPAIHDESYAIGREALANAFHHSQAMRVEAVLEYSRDAFRVIVRDNGRGMEPQILRSGRDRHWGLCGMRERAARIGARLKVLSAPGAGTEVDLQVPGSSAFESPPARGPMDWLARLYSRSGNR